MELEKWFSDWGMNGNPFDYTSDADRDPYLEQAFIQNIGLRTSLSLEKPNPLVVFGIKGSGKSSIRRDLEKFLSNNNDKVITLSYTNFNDLLKEKNKGKKIIPSRSFFSSETSQKNSRITLCDHLDNILRLGIEKLFNDYLSILDKSEIQYLIKEHEEQIRRLILLMLLYYIPNDLKKKIDGINKAIKLFKYKKKSSLFSGKGTSALAHEIYTRINGLPVVFEDIQYTIKSTGTHHFKPEDIPRDTEHRFTLLKYFIEILHLIDLKGIYLLVDRVDEHISINGDSEKMRRLITPLLSDQLLQVNSLGILMFFPYELQDLRKIYRSDRIKTICPLEWSPVQLITLVEKRMNLFSHNEIKLSELFIEDGNRHAHNIAVITLTPRNVFKFVERLIKEHCRSVTDQKKISSETLNITVKKYLMEKEEVQ